MNGSSNNTHVLLVLLIVAWGSGCSTTPTTPPTAPSPPISATPVKRPLPPRGEKSPAKSQEGTREAQNQVIDGDQLPETAESPGKAESPETAGLPGAAGRDGGRDPANDVGSGADHEAGHGDGHEDEMEHAHHDHFDAEGALVTNHGVALFQETQSAAGLSPVQRAQVIARRLNETAEKQGLDPQTIVARSVNGVATVYFLSAQGKGYGLATVDQQTASQFGFGSRSAQLTYWWRDVLRDHCCIIAGHPPLYTTPYSSVLQQLYVLCQKQQKGVPSHESFEQALAKLTPQQNDALQGLYIQVPRNYRPQAD